MDDEINDEYYTNSYDKDVSGVMLADAARDVGNRSPPTITPVMPQHEPIELGYIDTID